MKINIRPAIETDFTEIVQLFKEFSAFEKQPKNMTNTVERMMQEKDFFHCLVAEADHKIIGYVSYFSVTIPGPVSVCIWMISMFSQIIEEAASAQNSLKR